jgi:hypothetical protein
MCRLPARGGDLHMHDEREWRQYVAAVEVAGASEGKDRAQSSYYAGHAVAALVLDSGR